jgi:uncharacterized protein (TIGR02145 family)
LAPEGFHVPSDEEWSQLTNYLGGGMPAALRLRTTGIEGKGTEADQNSFSGLPGGNRFNNGKFFGLDSYGYWWTTTEFNATNSWLRLLNYLMCDVNSLSYNKSYGLSVRCLRK